jgi:hypothetical protein
MQTNIKRRAFLGMEIVSENLCFFGRKFGSVLDGFQKGELLNLNRHGF